jgi:hypothetical protein
METVQQLSLEYIFSGDRFLVQPPKQTGGDPKAEILISGDVYLVTFFLPKLVPGQSFLGLFASREDLPDAHESSIGDYALLSTGEVIQLV